MNEPTSGTLLRRAGRTRPRRTITNRILAYFAVTLLAFAATVGWSVIAQRRAAMDSEELAHGYVPVALRLAQLRATHATISTLVDGIPDERNPLSTRQLINMLASGRRAKFKETLRGIDDGLAHLRGPSEALARDFSSELTRIEAILAEDGQAFQHLFSAIDRGDKEEINRILVDLGAVEHEADTLLHQLADRVAAAMDNLSREARERERVSILALIVLAVVTLAVALFVSVQARRLLAPLGEVTERARAVAEGDLTPARALATDDELGELSQAFEKMVAAVGEAQSQALSNERFAAIGKMAAHVTHEVRNPLSAIGLNLDLLSEELATRGGEDFREARTLVGSIGREVERLERLSEEYLRVARLPSPRLEADHLPDVLRNVALFARPEVEKGGCTITLEVEPNLPTVLFDEAQIRKVLLNLLRNARESMPGGGAIALSATAEGMSVVVSVEDEGEGVAPENRERVFDPFFSTKGGGTGLGLAITRQMILGHGGRVWYESRTPRGSRFRFALPIAPARASLSHRQFSADIC